MCFFPKELYELINVLQNQLIEEKKKLATMEIKIRQEVCQEMAEQMVEIENNYKLVIFYIQSRRSTEEDPLWSSRVSCPILTNILHGPHIFTMPYTICLYVRF